MSRPVLHRAARATPPTLRPQVALVLALQYAAATLLVERPATLAALAGGALLYAAAARRPRVLLGAVLLAALGTWSVVVSQGLFYAGEPRTALLRLLGPAAFPLGDPPGLYVYREGLWYGLVQSLRFDAVLLVGAGLLARYATDELTAGLRRLHAPAPLCFLLSVALRHIPLLWGEVRTTWQTLRLRGLRPWGLRLLTPLAAANLRRADEVAAALLARGFSPRADAVGGAAAAPVGQRVLCWTGLAAVLALVLLQAAARLYRVGALHAPTLEPLFTWVLRHV